MSISRLHPLLVLFLSLSAAPAFSVEEINAGATIPNEAPMTKAEARDMIKSGNSGTEAVASISSPADGSTIKAMARNKLKYAVHGNNAFHAQLDIDGKKSVFLRKPIGTKKMPKLPAGPHELCVQALDISHKEVGKASCIKVIAQ